MYCYSVLTATFFWDTLENNQPGQNSTTCTELWDCLLYTVNAGLRNGGGISDKTVETDAYEQTGRYVAKFWFDIMFFILINVISLNIIFGIIIDTFASMRENEDTRGMLFLTYRRGFGKYLCCLCC